MCSMYGNAQQQYKSCLDSDVVKWSFLDYHIADAGPVSTDLIASTDIMINNILYKRLFISYFDADKAEETNENWMNYTPYFEYPWEDHYGCYYMRESEDASKLYLFNSKNNKEYLLSDISLQKGDVFTLFFPNVFIEAVVESVYYKNELKHLSLSYNLGGTTNSLTFIEGIGPDVWKIYPHETGYLNCFQNKNIFYKKKAIFGWEDVSFPCGCKYLFANLQIVSSDKSCSLTVTRDAIEVAFTDDVNSKISIYGIEGKLYYDETFSSKQKVTIPTTSFSNGVYLIKILNHKSNKIDTYKIML